MLKAAVINSGTRGSPRKSGEGMTGRRQVDGTMQCCVRIHKTGWLCLCYCNVGGNCVLILSGSSPSLFVSDANVRGKKIFQELEVNTCQEWNVSRKLLVLQSHLKLLTLTFFTQNLKR